MVIKVLWYVTMLSLNLWCLYFCLGPAVVEKNWTSLFKSLGQFTYLNHINHMDWFWWWFVGRLF